MLFSASNRGIQPDRAVLGVPDMGICLITRAVDGARLYGGGFLPQNSVVRLCRIATIFPRRSAAALSAQSSYKYSALIQQRN